MQLCVGGLQEIAVAVGYAVQDPLGGRGVAEPAETQEEGLDAALQLAAEVAAINHWVGRDQRRGPDHLDLGRRLRDLRLGARDLF